MNDKKITLNYLLAGGITGWIEAYTTWPMEYMKTQMQLKQNEKTMKHFIYAIKNQVQTYGFRSLYQGITPILLTGIPKVGIRFQVFEHGKKYLDDKNKSSLNSFFAGLLAGGVEASIIGVPSETLKTAMIEKNQSLKNVVKYQYKNYGLGGFYMGGLSTVIRHSMTQGTRFLGFNLYKKHIGTNDFLGGMFGGLCSVYGSQPFDVIKTRKQGEKTFRKKIREVSRDIYRELGIVGFWKGSLPRLLRVCPGQGITFFAYGHILNFLNKNVK